MRAARLQVPRYDARFRGYGLNKVEQAYRMAAMGFEFRVRVAGGSRVRAGWLWDASSCVGRQGTLPSVIVRCEFAGAS